MPMATHKSKTNQCPQIERGPYDRAPPWFRARERSFRFEHASRCRAIQNDSPLDSICSGRFFLPLRLHVSTTTGC